MHNISPFAYYVRGEIGMRVLLSPDVSAINVQYSVMSLGVSANHGKLWFIFIFSYPHFLLPYIICPVPFSISVIVMFQLPIYT